MNVFILPKTIAEACGLHKRHQPTEPKKFKAVVHTMKTSGGNRYYCRIENPNENTTGFDSEKYFDIFESRIKGRMEYEAAVLNRFFNLPDSKEEYIDMDDFKTGEEHAG